MQNVKARLPFRIVCALLVAGFAIFIYRKYSAASVDETFACTTADASSLGGIIGRASSGVLCLKISSLDITKIYNLKMSVRSPKDSILNIRFFGKSGVIFPNDPIKTAVGISNHNLYFRPRKSEAYLIIQSVQNIAFEVGSIAISEFKASKVSFVPTQNDEIEGSNMQAQKLLTEIWKAPEEKLSRLDQVLLLNQFVFNYCTYTPPLELNSERLFTNCRTQCGGYSYVLSELLKAKGIPARRVGIYNIPAQGNHSLAEAFVNGKWILLDPTFGVVFKEEAGGVFLSLNELEFNYFFKDPKPIIFQAARYRDAMEAVRQPQYTLANFNSDLMKSTYYTIPESFGSSIQSTLTSLSLKLTPSFSKLGVFSGDAETAQKSFLQQTNDLLNDSDIENDISFQVSSVGDTSQGAFRPFIVLANIKKNADYRLKFYVFSDEASSIEIKHEDALKRVDRNKLQLDKGANTVNTEWRSTESEAFIILNASKHVSIYGYALELVEN